MPGSHKGPGKRQSRKKVSSMIVAAEFRKIEFKGPLRLRNKTVISDLYENDWNGRAEPSLHCTKEEF